MSTAEALSRSSSRTDPALTKAMEQIAKAMQSERDNEVLRLLVSAIQQSKPADLGPHLSALAEAITALKKPVAYEFEVTLRDNAGHMVKATIRPAKR